VEEGGEREERRNRNSYTGVDEQSKRGGNRGRRKRREGLEWKRVIAGWRTNGRREENDDEALTTNTPLVPVLLLTDYASASLHVCDFGFCE
jgi:hypothetical protein